MAQVEKFVQMHHEVARDIVERQLRDPKFAELLTRLYADPDLDIKEFMFLLQVDAERAEEERRRVIEGLAERKH